MNPNSFNQRGMTLIELLVALSLTGGLATAVLGLTARQLTTIHDTQDDTQPDAAMKLLMWDLQHAEQISESSGALRLESRCSIDPITHNTRFEPAEIEYKLERINDQTWLTRTQLLNDQPQRKLVTLGISRLQFGNIQLTDGPSTSRPIPRPNPQTTQPETNEETPVNQIIIETTTGQKITRGYLP